MLELGNSLLTSPCRHQCFCSRRKKFSFGVLLRIHRYYPETSGIVGAQIKRESQVCTAKRLSWGIVSMALISVIGIARTTGHWARLLPMNLTPTFLSISFQIVPRVFVLFFHENKYAWNASKILSTHYFLQANLFAWISSTRPRVLLSAHPHRHKRTSHQKVLPKIYFALIPQNKTRSQHTTKRSDTNLKLIYLASKALSVQPQVTFSGYSSMETRQKRTRKEKTTTHSFFSWLFRDFHSVCWHRQCIRNGWKAYAHNQKSILIK